MIRIHSLHDLHDEEVLRGVVAAGESSTLEFKRGIPSATDVARLMASFANSEGGLILFGIDENGRAVGIEDIDGFSDLVLGSFAVTDSRISGYSSGIAYLDGKPIGCILIWPEHGLPVSVDGKYFRRVGSTAVAYDQTEIRQVIEEREKLAGLFISPVEIRRFLDVASEDTLIEVLLVPIMRKLGFKCVTPKGHTDRSLEYGQDIRGFKLRLPTGHWLYFAAQVKTGPISYSSREPSKNIEEILTQVRMAFGKRMFDFETNSSHLPDHVFLIASGRIVEGARAYLCEQLSDARWQRILFWDSNLIIERCEERGLPRGVQLEIRRYLNTTDEEPAA